MEKIFQIATNISTPLSLAGFFGAILFYTIRIILSSTAKAKHNEDQNPGEQNERVSQNKNIYHYIVNKLFILCLVAMCLGFLGFIIVKVEGDSINNRENDKSHLPPINRKTIIQGIVFIDNKETQGVQVKILEIEKTEQTNFFGKFKIEFYTTDEQEEYTIHFTALNIDTIIRKRNDSVPKGYFLFSKVNNSKTGALNKSKLINSPRLVSAVFESQTLLENKDHDTGIFLTILSEDGRKVIAQIENAENTRDGFGDERKILNDALRKFSQDKFMSSGKTEADRKQRNDFLQMVSVFFNQGKSFNAMDAAFQAIVNKLVKENNLHEIDDILTYNPGSSFKKNEMGTAYAVNRLINLLRC